MNVKLFAIFLFLGAAAYAAPTNEVEEDDANDMDEAEDEDLVEDEPKRYSYLYSKSKYCVCKKNFKGDEPEMNEDYVDEHLEDVAEDTNSDSRKKRFKRQFGNLIRPFFRQETLSCRCTSNRAVVRLLLFINRAREISRIRNHEFGITLKRMMESIKRQRRG